MPQTTQSARHEPNHAPHLLGPDTRLRDAVVAVVLLAVMAALASVLLMALMACGVGFFWSLYSFVEFVQPTRDLLVLFAPNPTRDVPLMVGLLVLGGASAYGTSQAFVRLPELGAWLSAGLTPWLVPAQPGVQRGRLRQVFDRMRVASMGAPAHEPLVTGGVVLPATRGRAEAREALGVPAWHEMRGR